MSTSTADFSQILELQQFKKLYEQQGETSKILIRDKEEEIETLRGRIQEREQIAADLNEQIRENDEEIARLKQDFERLKQEAQAKIDKLTQRARELNGRLG